MECGGEKVEVEVEVEVEEVKGGDTTRPFLFSPGEVTYRTAGAVPVKIVDRPELST